MGPIGSVLEPSYDLNKYARLPYSCTHCGSCGDICPVKVPVPELILYWRSKVVEKGLGETLHNIEQALAVPVLKDVKNLMLAEKAALWGLRNIPKSIAESSINPWASEHVNPEPPRETFRQYYNRVVKPEKTAQVKDGIRNSKE